jgi:hypothetical protein
VLSSDPGNFVRNQSTANENEIGTYFGSSNVPLGPFYESEPIWKCLSIEASGLTADGGWDNFGDCLGIDPKKAYRSVVWFRYTGPASGYVYHGCDYNNTVGLDGTPNTNPYFVAQPLSIFTADKWYCSIGIINGSQYVGVGSASGITGVYDPETGGRVYIGAEFSNKTTATYQNHRAYLYYCANAATRLYFAKPRFEEINGNEPSVLSVLGRASTGMMPSNAATLVLTSTVASVNVTSANSVEWVGVTSIAIPAQPFPYDYIATVRGTVTQDGTSGSIATFTWLGVAAESPAPAPVGGNHLSTIADATGTGLYLIKPAFIHEDSSTEVYGGPLGAGNAVTLYVKAMGWFPFGGGTSVLSNVVFKVEVLKR